MQTPDGHQPIETIRVGQRVATFNSEERDQFESVPDTVIVSSSWCVVTVRQDQGEAGVIEADLLRPLGWFGGSTPDIGDWLVVDLEELGLAGETEIIAVNDCPVVIPGPGRVVLSVFRHSQGVVGTLHLQGVDETNHVTAGHPVWSVDRKAWVPVENLESNEHTSAWQHSAKIKSYVLCDVQCSVFNVEVSADHCYRVGSHGLLVHNCSCPAERDGNALTKSLGASPYPSNVPASAHHIFPVTEFDTPLGRKLCCWGIDLNSKDNGLWLPYCDYPTRKASVHRGRNTQKYIADVVADVGVAKSAADALAILADIKTKLLDGTLKVNNADEKKPC